VLFFSLLYLKCTNTTSWSNTPKNPSSDWLRQRARNGVVGAMPSVSSIKNILRRIRKRNDCVPTDPKSLFDLDISVQFRKTKMTHNFCILLHDSGPSNNRIIIFSIHDNLDIMDNYSDWFADGAFKTSPLIFSQVYTIHVLVNENIIIPTFMLYCRKKLKKRIFVH